MSTQELIIQQLRPGVPLTDAQLASRLKMLHQQVNQACRKLTAVGRLVRHPGPDGFIVNELVVDERTESTEEAAGPSPRPAVNTPEGNALNAGKGRAFEDLAATVLGGHFGVRFSVNQPTAIGSPPKDHRFDLVSEDGRFIGECKNYCWTAGNNVPSAKMGFINEAVFYLSHVFGDAFRFVVLRRDVRLNGESLAEYYHRTYRHLLGGVHVLEIDSATAHVREIR